MRAQPDLGDILARTLDTYYSCAPVDHAAIETAFEEFYELGGRKAPPVHWVESPWAMVRYAWRSPEHVFRSTRTLLHERRMLITNAGDAQLTPSVRADALTLLDRKTEALRTGEDVVLPALYASRPDESASLRRVLWHQHYGHHDAPSAAYYSYLLEAGTQVRQEFVDGAAVDERLTQTGWWLGGEEEIVASERPTSVVLDAQHRLHCLTGPAVVYADGARAFAIDGEGVEERVVLAPESLDLWYIVNEKSKRKRYSIVAQMISRGDERRRELALALAPQYSWDSLSNLEVEVARVTRAVNVFVDA